MDELCPVCLKMGSNKRIKAVQINLEEAIWMCENEECPWPFGYEEPDFIPRKVGEKWAYEWEIYKKVQKRVGPIPVSTELSLYTPPVTPSSDTATKDAGKSDISSVSSISNMSDNDHSIFSSISIPDDSYAPKFDKLSCRGSNELPPDSDSAKKMPSVGEKDFTIPNGKSSLLPSIFDVDGDELLSNKMSVNRSCLESETTRKSAPSDILDVINTDKDSNKVLKTSDKPDITFEETLSIKETNIVPPAKKNVVTRGIPHIISIAKTKIDLPRKNCRKMTKIDRTELSIKAEPQPNEKMRKPLRQKSIDNIDEQPQIPGQCTTTITVDGILPITLSYDLADLDNKTDKLVPVTSTPVRQRSKRNLPELLNDELTLDLTNESPRKMSKLVVPKRRAIKSKQYEKFSFSSLKKIVQDSKECVDRTMIDSSKTAEIKVEEIKEEKPDKFCSINERISPTSSIDNLEKYSIISDLDRLNKPTESLISVNHDPNNSIISGGSSVVNFDLSTEIDDLLLDGCQNVTENLNDDWLESFFT